MSDTIPRDFHNLRACMLCHLIKHADQFEKHGCENCEDYIGMRHHGDIVAQCTTSNFSGTIALCQPDDSWVARWQRINRRVRGLYAIDVVGKLPSNVVAELRRMGVVETRPPRWIQWKIYDFHLFVHSYCVLNIWTVTISKREPYHTGMSRREYM